MTIRQGIEEPCEGKLSSTVLKTSQKGRPSGLVQQEELENISTEEELQKAGRVFLHKIEDMMVYSPFFIRPQFNSIYLARGSLHMLADIIAIGWHIDFRLYFQHLRP